MKIKKILTGVLDVNTYIISNDNKCFVVDPGGHAEKIMSYINYNNFALEAILLTHGHFDHIGAVNVLSRNGAKIYIAEQDFNMLNNIDWNWIDGHINFTTDKFIPDVFVSDNQFLEIAGLKIQVVFTPGHTPGGVCFLVEKNTLFSGDTLFYETIGRADFNFSNYQDLIFSLRKKLMTLPDSVVVYPGHGQSTTIGFERRNNPYA